ncbi:hypothetical protein ACN47A_01015 [Myxococcus fulvus]|uniref:hypothetical protein n=1 Tax=Myxococcus fulvus TaxID=33 RepID=UPI003B996DC5
MSRGERSELETRSRTKGSARSSTSSASEAVSWYDEVEALAPGGYPCRAERWLAAGRIPYQAFTVLRALELPSLGAEDRLRLTRQAIGAAPGVPGLHLQLGRQLTALDRKDDARAALEVGLAQAEAPDLRSRRLVESAADAAPSADRDRMLHEAMEPGGNLVAAAMARVLLPLGSPPVPGALSRGLVP